MSNWLRHLCFVAGFVALMGASSWLLVGESSPFHTYFIHRTGVLDLWTLVHLPPIIFSIIVRGNAHHVGGLAFITGFILQWAFVGLLLSLLVQKIFLGDDHGT